MNALEYYERLYGDLGLSPKDAAKWVFTSGWNCAFQELLHQLQDMPLEKDTKASFAVYFQRMMHIDPSEVEGLMQ